MGPSLILYQIDSFYRIEETWITWENLKKECACLENWLEETHLNIDSSTIENMDVRSYQEELDNYEVNQS